SRGASLRAHTTRSAPSAAHDTAAALPTPLLAPGMTATFPARGLSRSMLDLRGAGGSGTGGSGTRGSAADALGAQPRDLGGAEAQLGADRLGVCAQARRAGRHPGRQARPAGRVGHLPFGPDLGVVQP